MFHTILYYRRLRISFCYLLVATAIPFVASGQQAGIIDLLSSLKGLNDRNISYRYRVSLVNHKTGEELDNLSGSFFKLNEAYLDSNASDISLRDKNYILQISTLKKAAYIKSVRNIEALSKRKLTPMPVTLFDIRLIKPENIISTKVHKDDKGNTIINLSLRATPISDFVAVVEEDGRLKRLMVKMNYYSENVRLNRILIMEDFDTNVPADRIDVGHYILQNRNRIILKGRYAKYKLIQLV